MTQTQRITNEVYERHLPQSPEACLYALESHGEMCGCEHCRFHRSQPYMDADGQMRHGYDLKAPEPITGSFYVGMFWAFAIEGTIALAVWIGIHIWRWL